MNAEIIRSFLDLCKEANACEEQYSPALAAFERGDYAHVAETARGNREWVLKNVDGPYPFDMDNGRAVCYHDNGAVKWEGEYRDGKRHGRWAEYHENGTVSLKGEYLNGKQHGLEVAYYEDGSVMYKYQYVNGKKSGRWAEYREDGTVRQERRYANGELKQRIKGG
ncbi:MAG: hypothetical protein E6R03_04290 [Hyphomicrobiaceae bacterium]|nr:MAG: hypothetical protein E6R03_04290 [Hyphomicrobiaceae bacterium]